jgi:hypothetical protein
VILAPRLQREKTHAAVDPHLGRGLALGVLGLAVWVAPLPLAALAAIAYVVLAALDPIPALALVVFAVPFSPLGRPVGRYAFSPLEISIVLATLAYLLRVTAVASGWSPRSTARLAVTPSGDPIILALVGLVVLTGVVSLTASVVVHQSLESLRVVVVEPALFYLLVVAQTRARRDLAVLALALVAAGLAISLVGGWQYLTNERIITAEEGLRRLRAI